MKLFTKKALIFAGVFLLSTTIVDPLVQQRRKIILWDLGFVLLEPDMMKIGSSIAVSSCWPNLLNFLRLAVLYGQGDMCQLKLQDLMDDVMHHAYGDQVRQTVIVNQYGRPLSNLECDQMNGAYSDAELYAKIQESIRALEEADKVKSKQKDRFFKSNVHKFFIEAALRLRFAQQDFYGTCFKPIPAGVKLLERCAARVSNEIAILSNAGAEYMPSMLLHKKNSVIFKHIKPENIFISGLIKVSKPFCESYLHVIRAMNARPDDFIFIDDQKVNVDAALSVGMHAIHLTDYKDPKAYKVVENELKRLGAL
jgi:HAD superfamily hydrolase (TIGR01509 family)